MTEQEFKRKIINRIILKAIFTVTLIMLFFIAEHGIIEPSFFNEYNAFSFTCIISAIIASSIKHFIVLKNPKFFKKQYIAESDERNKQISLKAWAWTGYMSIYVIFVSAFFMPPEVMRYVFVLTCVPLIVYVAVYKVLQSKM